VGDRFQLIPAIDLMDGQCVRLTQGRADKKQVYSDNPPEMARSFEMAGAKRLHVVDLDGAFLGKPVNLEAIKGIRDRVGLKIQAGGGMRSIRELETILGLGVDWAIVGTLAAEDPSFVKEAVSRFGDRIIVGIDARQGKVATRGWVEARDLDALQWAGELEKLGVKSIIYTDIDSDGSLAGPNLEAQTAMAFRTGMIVLASGGVASIEDVRALAALPFENLRGVIVGKAIYTGKIDLPSALETLEKRIYG
jgi:phosphoribosylformimino-5-aminoimidazole carboxamide ribotide isomerase